MSIILQKSLLTTQQTTYRFGALGNSGDKSAEERGFPSGKGRKKPFSAESAIINAFGMSMPQVRTLSLRPKILIRKNGDFYFLPLTSSLLLQKCGCYLPKQITAAKHYIRLILNANEMCFSSNRYFLSSSGPHEAEPMPETL